MGPLDGIRVLDLSRVAPHAYCTMMLADMGAEVIKVEQPRGQDEPIFGSGVSPLKGESGRAATAFTALLRNKKSIAIDLKTEQGHAIFMQLACKADVIVDGFRPGVVKRLRIDYENIRRINPRMIYCSISGYGQTGPYAGLPGHDPNYIAIAGALGLIGNSGEAPVLPLNLLADYAGGGLMATVGILLALIAAQKSGRGQYLDISMTDGVVSLLVRFISDYFMTGDEPGRGNTMFSGVFPWATVYRTKDDGYITLGCFEPKFWENLCRSLGKEDFIPKQFAGGQEREAIRDCFQRIFLTKTRDEWFDFLKSKDICIAPVYQLGEVFSDPQIAHRKMMLELDHPTEGKVKQVGLPIKLSDTPGGVRSFGPFLGEHTAEILKELGYNSKKMADLRHDKVVM